MNKRFISQVSVYALLAVVLCLQSPFAAAQVIWCQEYDISIVDPNTGSDAQQYQIRTTAPGQPASDWTSIQTQALGTIQLRDPELDVPPCLAVEVGHGYLVEARIRLLDDGMPGAWGTAVLPVPYEPSAPTSVTVTTHGGWQKP